MGCLKETLGSQFVSLLLPPFLTLLSSLPSNTALPPTSVYLPTPLQANCVTSDLASFSVVTALTLSFALCHMVSPLCHSLAPSHPHQHSHVPSSPCYAWPSLCSPNLPCLPRLLHQSAFLVPPSPCCLSGPCPSLALGQEVEGGGLGGASSPSLFPFSTSATPLLPPGAPLPL